MTEITEKQRPNYQFERTSELVCDVPTSTEMAAWWWSWVSSTDTGSLKEPLLARAPREPDTLLWMWCTRSRSCRSTAASDGFALSAAAAALNDGEHGPRGRNSGIQLLLWGWGGITVIVCQPMLIYT